MQALPFPLRVSPPSLSRSFLRPPSPPSRSPPPPPLSPSPSLPCGIRRSHQLCEVVLDHVGLKDRGDVHVDALDALAGVVLAVVDLELCGHGDADREVGEDGHELVEDGALEGEVVRELVDGEEQVVVGKGAHEVPGQQQPADGLLPHNVSESDLQHDDREGLGGSAGRGVQQGSPWLSRAKGVASLSQRGGEARQHLGRGPGVVAVQLLDLRPVLF